jgi:two-component system response regulator FlrC
MSTEMKLSDALEPVAVDSSSQLTMALARRVAATDCSVLIVGESGTGKEVLARLIHRSSPRAKNSFVAVNCAAIPENMLEAMLFGYERGSFTGAVNAHAGKFEQAQGGTILLDEITEMPLALQAKLLRVLQEREVERLGGSTPVSLDVRVIATTNRLLRDEVAAGRFREDLYYRLNVFPLALTPLRERRDDILPLATHLLQQRARPGQRIPALSATWRICFSPTTGPATCASSTISCNAPWCSTKARSSRPNTSSSRCSRRAAMPPQILRRFFSRRCSAPSAT